MKFSDFVSVEAIRPSVSADSKEGVIREMTQSLVDAEKIATSKTTCTLAREWHTTSSRRGVDQNAC